MLQQHQVGALFGLFVRAIGAARFVRAVAPVAALVAVASVPLPRTATSIDIAAPSSGFVHTLAAAQQATHPRSLDADDASLALWLQLDAQDAQRIPVPRVAHAAPVEAADDIAGAWPPARIGDRWLQLRAEHAKQKAEEPSPRHVGDRLLHASAWPGFDLRAPASALEAFASLRDTLKPVASTGAEPRAPPVAASQPQGAGDPQPASANGVAQAASATAQDSVPTTSAVASAQGAAAAPTKNPPETLSPLKLSAEQRNIARFVARRYRVGLDDVQRFVAHAYRAAGEFHLDPHLVLAVMSIESSFNPNARSSAGAQGLMQVLTRVHLDKFEPYGGARAALDPMANITVGSRILKEYLVREGTVEGALKSYVGAALLSHDFGYGRKVLAERARIAAAARNAAPPTLTARAGGDPTKIAMASSSRTGKTKPIAGAARLAQRNAQPSNGNEAQDVQMQASEARAASTSVLTPSAASREL